MKIQAPSSSELPLKYIRTRCLWQIRLVLIFLAKLGVTEILHSFRLVQSGVTTIWVLGKVFRKEFCFVKDRRQHLSSIKWRKCSRFTFVKNTISYSPNVTWPKFLRINRLFCFISINKFGSFHIPFATITNLSGLLLRCKRFIMWVQTRKKWFLWAMTATKTIKINEVWPNIYDGGIYTSVQT